MLAPNILMKGYSRNHHYPAIYRLLNLVNGKCYIGQAQDLSFRLKEHRRYRKCPNLYLKRALNKHHWDNFHVSVLERVENLSSLNEREQYWMNFFQSYEPGKGYNIARIAGSTRGVRHSAHTLRQIVETRRKNGHPFNGFAGKKVTPENKALLSSLMRARWLNPEYREKYNTARIRGVAISNQKQRKRVEKVDIESGIVEAVYESLSAAARSVNRRASDISMVCNGRRKQTAKKNWRFAE